jgi:hypothetical protein
MVTLGGLKKITFKELKYSNATIGELKNYSDEKLREVIKERIELFNSLSKPEIIVLQPNVTVLINNIYIDNKAILSETNLPKGNNWSSSLLTKSFDFLYNNIELVTKLVDLASAILSLTQQILG